LIHRTVRYDMKTMNIGTIAALALSFGACSHDEKPAQTGYEEAMTPAAHSAPSAPGTLGSEATESLSDPQITTILRAVNVSEVDQARTAVGKVHDEEAKKFAEMMIAQHGQAVKDIDGLNTKLGFQQTDSQLATELGVKATRVEQQLSKTNDASFDRLYILGQIDQHRQVLDTIDSRLVPAARRDEVKDLLQTLRPVVADHLQMAQRILDGLK
jgi:putative membrane protein